MARSIAQRTFRLFLLVNLLLLLTTLLFAWWALEDLEETMLLSDRQVELDYFRENGDRTQPQRTITAQLVSAFLPDGFDEADYLPIVFHGLPVPFQGEIEFLDKEYFVVIQHFEGGNYYLAKDMALFEAREQTLTIYVLTLALVMGVASYVLATLFSRQISAPVRRFALAISQLDEQRSDSRLQENFVDAELNEVAGAINHYLDRIESSLQREKTLINLASHELRTPVSVILGAARIIEKRQQLAADDARTLQRIIDAAEDMSANIRTLLALVRGSDSLELEPCRIGEMLEQLHQDYALENPANAQRLHIARLTAEPVLQADKALARMLLHNLISNALHHTAGTVTITQHPTYVEVCDEGGPTGVPLATPNPKQASGLGLYIVHLACQQLGWQVEASGSAGGTRIRIDFAPLNPGPA